MLRFIRLSTNTATESYEDEAALTPSTQKKTKVVTGFCKKNELEKQLVASGTNHGRRYYYYVFFRFSSTLRPGKLQNMIATKWPLERPKYEPAGASKVQLLVNAICVNLWFAANCAITSWRAR